jgi:uncharacterized protein YjbI with pentapeptide repeats
MANPEHLEILKQGVKVWNAWRRHNPNILPYLNDTDLSDIDLKGVHFRYTLLERVNFHHTNLSNADLIVANLRGADLHGTNLYGADLRAANLSRADLCESNFTNAILGQTTFAENDLSQVKGVEMVRYDGPSYISIDTLYKSGGKIPEAFLRGCGVPDEFITYMRSLVANPIQFYSCFISYSSKDQEFAERLYADLQNKGVRCWFAPEDLKIGDKIRDRIDESIRLRDKLLLILSENSIASDWVEHEVESALEEERQQGRTILFPIRLDDAVMESNKAWAGLIRRTRHVGDFTRWKDYDSYQKALDRLLRDLKAEDKTASS